MEIVRVERAKDTDSVFPNFVVEPATETGSILSPLLANIYLHYVLDEWFVWVNHKHFRRTAHMVRYADDVLFTFDSEVEALDFHKRLLARLSDFGLSVNEAKTRIILHQLQTPSGCRLDSNFRGLHGVMKTSLIRCKFNCQ